MMPSRKPGKFSTSVVVIRAPPAVTDPSTTSGCSAARAAYTAAVYPAGPDPTMMTLQTSVLASVLAVLAVLVPVVDCDCVMDVTLPAAGEGCLVSHRPACRPGNLRSVQRIVGERDSRAEGTPYAGRAGRGSVGQGAGSVAVRTGSAVPQT